MREEFGETTQWIGTEECPGGEQFNISAVDAAPNHDAPTEELLEKYVKYTLPYCQNSPNRRLASPLR